MARANSSPAIATMATIATREAATFTGAAPAVAKKWDRLPVAAVIAVRGAR
jgi:hypothetical protein